MALYNETHPDWAPSINLGYSTPARPADRYERLSERKVKKANSDCAQALLDLSMTEPPEPDYSEIDNNPPTETTRPCKFILLGPLEGASKEKAADDRAVRLEKQTEEELNRLTLENVNLKKELSMYQITEESLKESDDKVKFYTGLQTYFTLMTVLGSVKGCIEDSKRVKFTVFQKLVMVLMKLRLNLTVQDLGDRFRVSTATVSRTIDRVLDAMYVRLREFVYWPDRTELRMTMPMDFRRAFGLKVASIIDCFEIFIERPSSLEARAATWSQYKHHNTVKFLIGITPQGSISFISKAWGGRASDKHITENCGFLDKIIPGDIILADRGFDIRDSVGFRGAEAKIPAFTKGKSQLSPLELELTRKITHLRIHVERVIGQLRNKFTVLQSILPIDYVYTEDEEVPMVEKMVTVCSVLINLNESVVPFN